MTSPRRHDPGEPMPENSDEMSVAFEDQPDTGSYSTNMRFRAGHRGSRNRVVANIRRRFQEREDPAT